MFGKRKPEVIVDTESALRKPWSADLFPGQIEIGTIEATPGVDLRKMLEEMHGAPVTDKDIDGIINGLSDLNRKALNDLTYIQPVPDTTHPN